jgi:hypothetical protein
MADRDRHRNARKQQPQTFFPELIDVQATTTTMQPKSTPPEATMVNDVNYYRTPQQVPQQQQSMLEMEDDNDDFFLPFDDDDCDDLAPSSLDDLQHRLSDVTTSISMDTHEEIFRPSLVPLDGHANYEQPKKPRKLPRSSNRPVDVAMAQLQAFFGGAGSTSSSNRGNEKRFCSDGGSAPPARTENSSSTQEERKDQPQYPRRIIFGQSHSLPIQHQNSDPELRAGGTVDLSNISSSSSSFQKLQHKDRADSMPLEGLTRKSSMKKISSIGGKLYQSHSSLGCSSSNNGMKREISFGNLEIRQYDVALSDHPSCSYGPPVQLSWEYQRENVVVLPVDSYELTRSPRRDRGDLVLSYNDRRHMLLKQAGYSKKEVKQAMKEVDRVKRERLVTDMLLPASILDEAVEASVDYVKQFFLPSPQHPPQQVNRPQPHYNDNERPPQEEEHQEHKLLQPSFSSDESLKPSPCSVTAVPGMVLERKRHNQSATI